MSYRLTADELPVALRDDSILECVCEIRFQTPELDELVVGRLAEWAGQQFPGSTSTRTAAAAIPAPLRDANPILEFQPLFEFDSTTGTAAKRKIRIGPRVFSMIVTGRYGGWSQWFAELKESIDHFFRLARPVTIRRLGLRYTNALTADRHGITSLDALRVSLKVCSEDLLEGVNLAYRRRLGSEHEALVRVVTADVSGVKAPPNTTVVVDIDVRTPTEYGRAFGGQDGESVKQWIDDAHTFEKIEFFSLFPPDRLARLRV